MFLMTDSCIGYACVTVVPFPLLPSSATLHRFSNPLMSLDHPLRYATILSVLSFFWKDTWLFQSCYKKDLMFCSACLLGQSTKEVIYFWGECTGEIRNVLLSKLSEN